MRVWVSVVLDATLWLGLVWLGYFAHRSLHGPYWLLPGCLVPATVFLWWRIGSSLAELLATLFFLVGASAFFLVGEHVFHITPGLPDLMSYAICAGASLAGFRTWQPVDEA
jgi:hypothetical protein